LSELLKQGKNVWDVYCAWGEMTMNTKLCGETVWWNPERRRPRWTACRDGEISWARK